MCVHKNGRKRLGDCGFGRQIQFIGEGPLTLRNKQGVKFQGERYIWINWGFYIFRSDGFSFEIFCGPGTVSLAICRSLYWIMKLEFIVVLQLEQEALCLRSYSVMTLVGDCSLCCILFSKMSRPFYIRKHYPNTSQWGKDSNIRKQAVQILFF